MAVLGIDTATAVATTGVFHDGHVIAERTDFVPGRHAGRLPELVDEVLHEAEIEPRDLDAIAVSVGPGSFTGLRVAIGFAKGLAYGAGVRLVGISTTEALAALSPRDARSIAACLDARKGEVYLALFRPTNGRHLALERMTDDLALPPEEAVRTLAGVEEPVVVVGDAAESRLELFRRLPARILPFSEVHPRGGMVAKLGARLIGDAVDPAAVRPVYVRPSQAELKATLTTGKTL